MQIWLFIKNIKNISKAIFLPDKILNYEIFCYKDSIYFWPQNDAVIT